MAGGCNTGSRGEWRDGARAPGPNHRGAQVVNYFKFKLNTGYKFAYLFTKI